MDTIIIINKILKLLDDPLMTIPRAVKICAPHISYRSLCDTAPKDLWRRVTEAGFRNSGLRKKTTNTQLGRLCHRGHEHEDTGKSLRYISNHCCVICHNQRENRRLSLIDESTPIEQVLKQYPVRSKAHYLGAICPNAHKYHGYNYSERWLSNGSCLLCYADHRRKKQDHYKEYRDKNRSRINQKKRERELTPIAIESAKRYRREYRKNNLDKIREQARRWKQEKKKDPTWRLSMYMGIRIRQALHGRKMGQSWISILGYNASDLRTHLESQFSPEMSWGNYGTYWHIDHKKPISAFNYTLPTDDEFKRCWGLDNLRPLEKSANLAKSNRIYPEFENI